MHGLHANRARPCLSITNWFGHSIPDGNLISKDGKRLLILSTGEIVEKPSERDGNQPCQCHHFLNAHANWRSDSPGGCGWCDCNRYALDVLGPAPLHPPNAAPLQSPMHSFDARLWAESFVAHVAQYPQLPSDADTMTTWFASALMRGFDEARATQTTRTEVRSGRPVNVIIDDIVNCADSVDGGKIDARRLCRELVRAAESRVSAFRR